MTDPWTFTVGDSPLVATAIHAGRELPPGARSVLAVDEATRLREEDPYTDLWTGIAPNRIVVHSSRFVVDLDRSRDRTVYLEPGDAWGLDVWQIPPSREQYQRSLRLYDGFYQAATRFLDDLLERHERILVLDLHSYCHRRAGPDAPGADVETNPDVNVGTGSLNREVWGELVDGFIGDLRRFDGDGAPLDVRENVKFRGGHFSTWINGTFGTSACALAVEVKKTFMDEWTGRMDESKHRRIGEALQSTVPGLLQSIR